MISNNDKEMRIAANGVSISSSGGEAQYPLE